MMADDTARQETIALGLVPIDDDPFRVTVAGLAAPLSTFVVFELAAAASAALLGYPELAVAAFFATTTADLLFQKHITRWQSRARAVTTEQAFTRLSLASFARNMVLMAPPTYMALTGAGPQLAYLGVICTIGAMLSFANGSLSKKVFWSYALPPLIGTALVVATRFPFVQMLGVVIAIVTLAFLQYVASKSTTEVISSWQAAFTANRTLIEDLKIARDAAVKEKQSAEVAQEEAWRACQARSNFLANMSHELRTPLNAIIGFSELLLSGRFVEKTGEYTKLINESGRHLLNLVTDILDLSKIDGGRMSLSESEVDLASIADDCVRLMQSRADEGKIAFKSELHFNAKLRADERAIRQIFLNLIGNAVKFTQAGGSVTVFARNAIDGSVVFGVRDTGVGIALDEQEHVFESFGQGRHDAITQDRGTGLGLPIVRGLAQAHGGGVKLESEVGKGTRVTITLPASRVLRKAA